MHGFLSFVRTWPSRFSHILQVSVRLSMTVNSPWLRLVNKSLGSWNDCYTVIISGETTYAQPYVTTYMYENMTRRRACSWGFKDLTPNSPDPVCYRVMEAATYEEAQRTCRGMFADMLTFPDDRDSKEGEFGVEWEILCEVGLKQSKFTYQRELYGIKSTKAAVVFAKVIDCCGINFI